MTLLVKTALDATAQLLQHGSVDLTDLTPPLGAAKSWCTLLMAAGKRVGVAAV
jgi:hypothetical protein